MSERVKGSKALYFAHAKGKSYWLVTCPCLTTVTIYAWRGCKRCHGCQKVVYI